MTILTVGRRLVPIEQIALVEAFDANSNPDFKPEKDFKSRIYGLIHIRTIPPSW
jgi:hypothetical protein